MSQLFILWSKGLWCRWGARDLDTIKYWKMLVIKNLSKNCSVRTFLNYVRNLTYVKIFSPQKVNLQKFNKIHQISMTQKQILTEKSSTNIIHKTQALVIPQNHDNFNHPVNQNEQINCAFFSVTKIILRKIYFTFWFPRNNDNN